MNKKVVFYDADGTIIARDFISEGVLEAMKKLEERGILTVLSTGRSLPAITHSNLSLLNLNTAITAAGGAVLIDGEVVSHDYITRAHLKEITDYLDDFGLKYNLECNDAIYVKTGQKQIFLDSIIKEGQQLETEEETQIAWQRRNRWQTQIKECDDILSLHVNKIHWFEADSMYESGHTPLTYEDVNKEFGKAFNVNPLSFNPKNKGGEINEKAVTKRKGMEIIMNHYGIQKEDVYAIGDGFNDLQMLEFAPHSIAMGNAPQEVKDVCEYVTDDFSEDGFVSAMKHYQLID